MSYCNLLVLLSMIFLYYLVQNATSLSPEGIANGEYAPNSNFTYQAAILGRKNPDSEMELLGNGAIVSYNWILSAAQSFMEDSHTLKDYIFTASFGYSYLKFRSFESEQTILEVHTYSYNDTTLTNDIALARIEIYLNVLRCLRYSLGRLPRAYESFLNVTGKVSGFGDSDIEPTNLVLKYINVNVRHSSECAEDYPHILVDENKHFCGLVMNPTPALSTGVCWNDIGSPLVIGKKIVGIVSGTHRNCDDSVRGALYVNVSSYYEFVFNSMYGRQIPNVKTYATRQF